ncbi:hypothetical protein GCM10010112_23260 [Actinoplanes lobatus]|uniref:Uncharacterized protein n=1 Tax=Actinoplanes lobatus TaxID=113568 RepID=A0A7W7MIF4_9ACTN|nr:hypothetical protein [Actinoplanes lobatus]MBB4751368.1 hypothetical protein [Actinoplanes lobatus]GGN63732.1 hypothetical protein GCM10010112_23260 [Actinoplanes lobatus]GIE40978.1 hypothetical protein Alo02nite_38760 [Actinoplanes lobatus]
MPRRALFFVVSAVFSVVGAFLTWHGALGLLAQVPGAGDAGMLTVSYCAEVSRGGLACEGVFTTSDGVARTVSVQSADRVGATIEATVFPWDNSRAYARGSVLDATGTTVFGGTVLGMGVMGTILVARNDRRLSA